MPNATSPADSAANAASSDRISSSDGVEVAVPARDREPQDAELHVEVPTSLVGHRRCQPFDDGEVRRRLLERPGFELDAREHRRQLGIAGRHLGRERGQQRAGRRSPAVEARLARLSKSSCAACVQSPAACACRIASTTYPCSANQRAAARCSGRDLVGRGAAQLEPQQVGEQVVVAEPRSPRVERHDERVRRLEPLKDPLRA